MAEISRRRALGALSVGGVVAATSKFWWAGSQVDASVVAGTGPYGALQAVNADGLQLPVGFTSRVIARTGQQVAQTGYTWHAAPDGGACFGNADGGWTYVSNSEVSDGGGGVSAVRFNAAGAIVSASRILGGTHRNCAGGPTPWGTWLSCEENSTVGRVFECDPTGSAPAVARLALGRFNHEAAAVDASTGAVYLTEDEPTGRLYRFVPTTPGDLSAGQLYAAAVSGSAVTWVATSAAQPDRQASTTAFNGGEGAWIHDRVLYFTTKGDNRVWALDLRTQTIRIHYNASAVAGAALTGVDNITGHRRSGDLFVAEDGGNMEVCVLAAQGADVVVAPFLRVAGHASSELTGPAFNPAGDRMYVSSQRGADGVNGVTWEIRGPFRSVNAADALAPDAPDGVVATAAGSDVTVTWQPAADRPDPGGVGTASYWVVRDWTTQWLVSASGPFRYVDRGVAPGSHRYQVFAVDRGNRISAGSAFAIVNVAAVDNQAPNPPSGVSATVVGTNRVKVTWSAAQDLPNPGGVGVASYWVVRDWTTQWLVSANGPLEFTDTAAPSGARRYEVHAVDRGNRISGASTPARVTLP